MNLLTSNEDTVNGMILSFFKELGIAPDIIARAEKFFDFSKEPDFELLNFSPQNDINFYSGFHQKAKRVKRHVFLENSFEYSDRYILFLDALGSKAMYNLVAEYGFGERLLTNKKYSLPFFHAFLVRYGEKSARAKLISYACRRGSRYGANYSNEVIEIIQKEPRIIFEAGNFCNEPQNMGDKANFFALALAYADEYHHDVFTKAEIKHMTQFILKDAINNVNYSNDAEFGFEIPILFLTEKYDPKIRKLLEQKSKSKTELFIYSLTQCIPCEYFKSHIETVFDIIGKISYSMESSVKATVFAGYKGSFFDELRPEIPQINNIREVFRYEAENYPDDVIKVMFSNDYMGDVQGWGYVPKFTAGFFEEIYRVLEEYNPQALKEHHIDHDEVMLRFYVEAEQSYSKVAKEEIGLYLSGKADLSVLEPYFDKISDSKNFADSGTYQSSKILKSLENLPEFKGRYLAFKTIQNEYSTTEYARTFFRTYQQNIDGFRELVELIVKEGVPLNYRFDVYSGVIDYYWEPEEKQKIEETILEMMVKLGKEHDDEYKQLIGHKVAAIRKFYALYLGYDENGKNKDTLLKMCGDSSKEVKKATAFSVAKHKEYEPDVIALLSAKKQAVRETAVDILALWGADNYRDILEKAAETEKSAKLADKIRDILADSASPSEEGGKQISVQQLVEDIHKGGRNKKLSWLYETANPEVHFKNGNAADDKYLQAIILCYANMSVVGRNDNALILANELNEEELAHFAAEIFSKWYSDGAESKKKWALYFAVIHGGNDMIEIILRCIKDWAELMRGAIAAEAVKALALNGSSQALMAVDNLAHKFKQKQVKKAAVQAIDTAAEALGITADELGDRIVPDLGFDEKNERIFNYGTRKFKVYLSPALELEVFDESGKRLKNMPLPAKKDDEETAKKSNIEFKQVKKQLKNIISIQKMRLETALLADRRWSRQTWNDLFVKNPVMHSFAIGLIWSAYEGDEQVQTFRYMEDGSFNTSDEEEYELPENAKIGLVHPIDLDEDTLSAWKEQLSDYEIIQPIEQLDRKIYRVTDEEKGKLDLERFRGRQVNGMSLIGRTAKFGWYKGSAQDGGGFYVFYREDVTERVKNPDGTVTLIGNAAELHFEGMYIGGDDSDVNIEKVRFYAPGTIEHGSYVYDEADDKKAIELDKISPRYFSEIVNQLEEITKTK